VGPALSLAQAVRSSLRQHPAIARAQQLVAARTAQRLSADGPFDPLLTASAGHVHEESPLLPPLPIPGKNSLTQDTTSLNVGASAGFHWGMTVIPSVGIDRLDQRQDPNFMMLPPGDPVQRARADLTLLQPLLRGFGDGTVAGLRAAERGVLAAENDAASTAQERAFATISAYYRWVAAGSDLLNFRESLARTEKLFAETKELVDAEQRPRADLRQIEASRADQMRGLYEAESNVALSRYELALSMGLDGRAVPEWQPSDGFPEPGAALPVPEQAMEQALRARRDLDAADERVAEAAELLAGAEQNALPKLDLRLSVGYSGGLANEEVGAFFASTVRNIPGVNAGGSLTLELPFANDAQLGERDLRRAEKRTAEIERDDLARQVRSDVQSALIEVRLAALALGAADNAVALFTQAVQDERDKLHEGLSTIIDVVLTEERLTQSQLTQTAQRLRHALALARLQFQRGALPDAEQAVAPSAQALLTQEAQHGGR
jgi:outer membrane protein TolC